ncbi:MAG TPA: phosphopantetheine-binding protein [Fibrobacteraceae bacterium]|nr:phosphopantetheine-binding protein [Fibrobacteraceae bacterium]
MSDVNVIREELKTLIVESLDLEDVVPNEIGDDMTLFNEGLGLDSIDALELGMAISRKYGVNLTANSEENRALFQNVNTLANYIAAKKDE